MRLPAWLEPLPDAERMRATDAWAIDEVGVPSLDLMERAGEGLARVVADVAPDGRVVVLCGKGNNGGDGLVVARLLRAADRSVDVLLAGEPGELRGDPAANLDRLDGPPTRPIEHAGPAADGAAVIVDALLGTGFSGEPRDPLRGAIEAANASGAPIVAADVPSGVDASTGAVHGAAIRAVATATFHAAKPGLWIAPGKEHSGRVHVVEIGIPAGAPTAADAGLLGADVLADVPRRGTASTKFTSGNVVVAGGSTGLTGAPTLAAQAAARAGAGYVTACVARSLNLIFELRLLEQMTRPLPDDDGTLTLDAVDPLLEAAGRGDALVLGPGLGRDERTFAFARAVAERAELPLLLDADGLNAHAGEPERLAGRDSPTVVTPHAGELGRLLDRPSAEIESARLDHARDAARRAGAIVVLKGDDTLVAAPDGRVAVSPGGAPALATAGTGDVLSGTIGAMLGKRMDPFAAACAGVWAHLRAGQLAALASAPPTPDGVLAGDVVEQLPRALAVGPDGSAPDIE